jgi:hypothetical protein
MRTGYGRPATGTVPATRLPLGGIRAEPIRLLALAAFTATVLVAAGCGGNGKSAATTTTTTTVSTSTTTSTSSGAQTTTTSTSSSGLANIATAANCGQLAGLATSLAQAIAGAGSTDVDKISKLLQEFAARTPADIRPDFERVAAAYAKIVDALKGVDLSGGKAPSAAVIAKLTKLGTELNTPALQKSGANITAWAQTHCNHA